MNALKNAGITIDREMLSERAIHDKDAFSALVELSKRKLA